MRFTIVEQATGLVLNVIEWEGDTETWRPPEGCNAVQSDVANIGDTWDGTNFLPPPAPPALPMTAAQALAQRDALKAHATSMIDPLADAVELDDASPAEVAALKAWKVYRLALTRIEQQPGFPGDIEWPEAP